MRTPSAISCFAATAATLSLVGALTVPLEDAERLEERQGPGYIKLPIYRHDRRNLNDPEQTRKFAEAQHLRVMSKWGSPAVKRQAALEKRQTVGMTVVGDDSFYVTQVGIGSPVQAFQIILDTGSSDQWVVDDSCTSSQCTGVKVFSPGQSSSYVASNTDFSITYGSGAVRGTLATDTVSLAGYTVNSQTFAIVDQLATGTLPPPASGIMGMGFQTLSTSGATPFWQVLANQGRLQQNLFTFQMARTSNVGSSTAENPGGVFTLGLLDANQYSGEPHYVGLTGDRGYWTIAMDSFTLNGQNQVLNSGSNVAAIDTGTSLVIAPSSVAAFIYQNIAGSRTYGGSSSGTYAIPCSSNVQLSFTFGGQAFSINSQDMLNGALDTLGQYCLGGILGQDLGTGAPDYIVGDTFLKNVFSIYRASPAAVGFAALKGSSAQTAATSAIANTGQTATAASSSVAASTSIPLVPSLATTVSTNTATAAVVGGDGLPAPVAASTNSASTPSLVSPGQQTGGTTNGASSGTAATSLASPSITVAPTSSSTLSQPSLVTQASAASQNGRTDGADAYFSLPSMACLCFVLATTTAAALLL